MQRNQLLGDRKSVDAVPSVPGFTAAQREAVAERMHQRWAAKKAGIKPPSRSAKTSKKTAKAQ